MNEPLSELEQLTEEEIKGYEIYQRKYVVLYPPPKKPNPTKQGWEFKAYLVVCVAAVLLASMRTAEQFYRAATFSANPLLGYIEAFLAVFTVETGIVVYAAVLAARQKKISQWVMWVGIVLLASISIVAGLGQSLYLSTSIDPSFLRYTEYMLSILIGPGASIAALIGGHILGQQIAQVAQIYEEMMREYESETHLYNDKLMRAWLRSFERKVVLGTMEISRPYLTELIEESPLKEARAPLMEKGALREVRVAEVPMLVQAHAINDGNHHQKTVQVIRPAVANPASITPPPTDISMTRIITHWLISKGKTPFDPEINASTIAADVKIEEGLIRSALAKMRNAKPA